MQRKTAPDGAQADPGRTGRSPLKGELEILPAVTTHTRDFPPPFPAHAPLKFS